MRGPCGATEVEAFTARAATCGSFGAPAGGPASRFDAAALRAVLDTVK
jgi:hypothetical protein